MTKTPDQSEIIARELTVRDEARLKIVRNRYRRRPDEIPLELVEDALEVCRGNMTKTAEHLDVSFTRLASMVDKSPDLMVQTMRHRSRLIDKAEDVLESHLDQGDLKAATFTLKTIGKDRGYVERHEQNKEVRIEQKIDVRLDRLSSDQLRELRSIQQSAGTSDVITDAEYEDVG